MAKMHEIAPGQLKYVVRHAFHHSKECARHSPQLHYDVVEH